MSAIERTPKSTGRFMRWILQGFSIRFTIVSRVINEDPDLTMARLALSGAVRTVDCECPWSPWYLCSSRDVETGKY